MCACPSLQASTRYVTVEMRKRLMMVPIFDMKVRCGCYPEKQKP